MYFQERVAKGKRRDCIKFSIASDELLMWRFLRLLVIDNADQDGSGATRLDYPLIVAYLMHVDYDTLRFMSLRTFSKNYSKRVQSLTFDSQPGD